MSSEEEEIRIVVQLSIEGYIAVFNVDTLVVFNDRVFFVNHIC